MTDDVDVAVDNGGRSAVSDGGDTERSLTLCIEDSSDDGASTDRSGGGGERMLDMRGEAASDSGARGGLGL